MSKTFTVKVRGKIAAAEYTEPYVCDNSDYEIEFDFSEEWQVYGLKTARFAYGGKMQDVIFEGSRCGVPRMSGIRSFKVGVFAGDLSTTTPAYIEARASILSEGGASAVPAPDVYDQLMQRMNELEAPEAVLYTEQILTDEQKAQARANINADRFEVEIYRDRGTPYSTKTAKEIYDAYASGKTVEIAVDRVRAVLTECRMLNNKYYISCYVPRVTEAYTVVGLGSHMLYLDGVLGTAKGIWEQGLYNVTATAELAPITGIVTADKLTSPDHPTDLVAYDAFQAAVPLVRSMDITGAQVGQTIKVKAVNEQGMPTAWEAADMPSGGTDISLGLTSAAVGQTIKVKAIDDTGKPTAWEAADMPSGGGETWELINAIEIPDGAEETNALTISADKNGNAFSLKKARLITYFPKYTGESSIPSHSLTMINGFFTGPQSPICYSSGLPVPNNSKNPEGWLEVDLSMPGYEVERVARFEGSGRRPAELMFWGARRLNGAETITSIGGIDMLIYPGCKFTLYGVRA